MIFKRIISALTGTVMLATYSSVLAGCSMKEFFANDSSSEKEETNVSDGTLTNGEWIGMVNDAFGMQVDENAEDGEMDAAKAWGVIGEDEEIDKNAPVDDKFVTSTLMRAAGFADPGSSDEEIIQTAVEHGVISSPEAVLSDPQQAIESLTKAKDEWMNQEFEERRNIDLVEGVQNFTETMSVTDFKVTEDGVTIPSEYAKTLEKDSVFILPKNAETGEGGAYKVVAKVDNGNGKVSVKGVPAAPEEVYEKIDVSGKFYADMNTFEPAEGVTLAGGSNNPQGMSYAPEKMFATPLGNNNLSLSPFGTNELLPTPLANDDDDDKVEISASVSDDSAEFSIGFAGISTKVSINDIAINSDIDWDFGFFKGLELERIYMAVDYTSEIEVETELFDFTGEAAGKDMDFLLDRTYLSQPSIYLGKAAVYICPGISVNLRFDLTFETSGKLSVSVSTDNTKGFEMVGSNFRSINSTTKSVEAALTGEAGIYANFTLALSLDYIVGVCDLLSIKLKFGPVLKGEAKAHVDDEDRALLCMDVKIDLKIELKLVLLETVTKAFKLDASLTLVDEDIPVWDGVHIENFKKVPKCTLEDEEEEEETTEESTISVGIFALESSYISLDVGTSDKIVVKSLPSGYSASDLVWESSNPSIVSVDANGNITAVSAGTVSITISTKDGKNQTVCAVMAKSGIMISDNEGIGNSTELIAA